MNDIAAANPELRVLVLASTARDFELTRRILDRGGVESIACSDLADLCTKLRKGAGAAIIVEEALTGNRHEELSRCIVEQPSWSDLPLLVLARTGAESNRIGLAMEKLGNVTVLERPLRIVALVSAVRSALRARTRQYQVREDAEALAAARDGLELRVAERTAQLSDTNTQLEQKIRQVEAAEKRAHELVRELVSAQETERARIARDLHDELGQQLTSLRLHLSQLGRDLPANSKARPTLEVTDQEAERIDSRISFLAWMIRPTTIDELGLAKALAGYTREWSRNYDIPAEFRGGGRRPKTRLVPEIEINVYRIAQECLNNVAKYASATAVSVLLSISDKEVTLIIEDDGAGFNTNEERRATGNGGLGISGMRERTALLRGKFEIESSPGGGTAVYVNIPAEYR
jgi:signal transduction histidine kinase